MEEEPQNVEEIPVPTLPPPPEPDLNGLRRVQDHVEYLLELVEPLKPFGMSVLEAWNQVICEDIDSMINVPPNSTSKVAGYAVRATDLWQNNQVVESLQLATGTEHLGVGQAVPVDVGEGVPRGTTARCSPAARRYSPSATSWMISMRSPETVA